jgi:hypothetical protein
MHRLRWRLKLPAAALLASTLLPASARATEACTQIIGFAKITSPGI